MKTEINDELISVFVAYIIKYGIIMKVKRGVLTLKDNLYYC